MSDNANGQNSNILKNKLVSAVILSVWYAAYRINIAIYYPREVDRWKRGTRHTSCFQQFTNGQTILTVIRHVVHEQSWIVCGQFSNKHFRFTGFGMKKWCISGHLTLINSRNDSCHRFQCNCMFARLRQLKHKHQHQHKPIHSIHFQSIYIRYFKLDFTRVFSKFSLPCHRSYYDYFFFWLIIP